MISDFTGGSVSKRGAKALGCHSGAYLAPFATLTLSEGGARFDDGATFSPG